MTDTQDTVPVRPLGKRVLGWVAITFVAALLLFASLRVFIPPVAPGQTPPEEHFGGRCVVCHIVSNSIEARP